MFPVDLSFLIPPLPSPSSKVVDLQDEDQTPEYGTEGLPPHPHLSLPLTHLSHQYIFPSQTVLVLPLGAVKGKVREVGPCGPDEGWGGMAIWKEDEMEKRPKSGSPVRCYSNNSNQGECDPDQGREDGAKWIDFRDIWEIKLTEIGCSTNIC